MNGSRIRLEDAKLSREHDYQKEVCRPQLKAATLFPIEPSTGDGTYFGAVRRAGRNGLIRIIEATIGPGESLAWDVCGRVERMTPRTGQDLVSHGLLHAYAADLA